jgi:hypothetical protein
VIVEHFKHGERTLVPAEDAARQFDAIGAKTARRKK